MALCDVDQKRGEESIKKHPKAKTFTDFRRMFDEMGRGIDAVLVATPDHNYAVAAAAALQRGQHVYCEKPLTRTVHEARVLRLLARKHKVVTQLGNQGSSSDALRRAVELAWIGTIGEIREAYVWFPSGNGPLTRPVERPWRFPQPWIGICGSVISSCILANEETWRRGVALSFASACCKRLPPWSS